MNPGLILRLGMLRWGNQASDLVAPRHMLLNMFTNAVGLDFVYLIYIYYILYN